MRVSSTEHRVLARQLRPLTILPAAHARSRPPLAAEWFKDLRGEEFREFYKARGPCFQQCPRRAASHALRTHLLTRQATATQSGFQRLLRGRDRVGRRVTLLLPMRFPEVRVGAELAPSRSPAPSLRSY